MKMLNIKNIVYVTAWSLTTSYALAQGGGASFIIPPFEIDLDTGIQFEPGTLRFDVRFDAVSEKYSLYLSGNVAGLPGPPLSDFSPGIRVRTHPFPSVDVNVVRVGEIVTSFSNWSYANNSIASGVSQYFRLTFDGASRTVGNRLSPEVLSVDRIVNELVPFVNGAPSSVDRINLEPVFQTVVGTGGQLEPVFVASTGPTYAIRLIDDPNRAGNTPVPWFSMYANFFNVDSIGSASTGGGPVVRGFIHAGQTRLICDEIIFADVISEGHPAGMTASPVPSAILLRPTDVLATREGGIYGSVSSAGEVTALSGSTLVNGRYVNPRDLGSSLTIDGLPVPNPSFRLNAAEISGLRGRSLVGSVKISRIVSGRALTRADLSTTLAPVSRNDSGSITDFQLSGDFIHIGNEPAGLECLSFGGLVNGLPAMQISGRLLSKVVSGSLSPPLAGLRGLVMVGGVPPEQTVQSQPGLSLVLPAYTEAPLAPLGSGPGSWATPTEWAFNPPNLSVNRTWELQRSRSLPMPFVREFHRVSAATLESSTQAQSPNQTAPIQLRHYGRVRQRRDASGLATAEPRFAVERQMGLGEAGWVPWPEGSSVFTSAFASNASQLEGNLNQTLFIRAQSQSALERLEQFRRYRFVPGPGLVAGSVNSSFPAVWDNVQVGWDHWVFEVTRPRCNLADVGSEGASVGSDFSLDNNDFVVFISWFFDSDPRADIGGEGGAEFPEGDGILDSNDFIVFINRFFQGGCNPIAPGMIEGGSGLAAPQMAAMTSASPQAMLWAMVQALPPGPLSDLGAALYLSTFGNPPGGNPSNSAE